MIDLYVISGFLGAGKTTLANKLLNASVGQGKKAVYIVNEFGETDIDAELMRFAGFEAMTLTNGCICCSLSQELTHALKEIIQTFAPEIIVFETSGIFVFPAFDDLIRDEYLQVHCRIRSKITIVDSLNYLKKPWTTGSFVENQIANASLLVISKLERFEGDLTELVCDLRRINPDAMLLARPWNQAGFIGSVMDNQTPPPDSAGKVEHHHARFETGLLRPADMSNATYTRLVKRIVSGDYGLFLRVKGFLSIDGQTHLLNIAQSDATLQKTRFSQSALLVFIGSGFTSRSLGQLLCGL